MANENTQDGASILQGAAAGTPITEGVHILAAQGHVLVVELAESVVMVDCGRGGKQTQELLMQLRAITEKPISALCYSHGHGGYNAGVDVIRAHNAERGDLEPNLIAHENVAKRYNRYRETRGYQQVLARMQFPGMPKSKVKDPHTDPTITFSDSYVVNDANPRVELFWVPSETDDAIAVWLPEQGVLYGGAATPGDAIPNIGTPLRTQRLTVRWAESLDRMLALNPEILLTEFGTVVRGRDAVRERLEKTAEALRYLRAEVVVRLNRGMSEGEILADMEYPEELFRVPWMKPNYGSPDYIVRDLVREESGWWDRNPTSLHPADPDAVAEVRWKAIENPKRVIEQATELADKGEVQLALHVIDLVALGPKSEPVAKEARKLKAKWCLLRAKEIKPYVSKALYASSANLLEEDCTWQDLA
jgi:uncharacterized sulfatase